MKMRNSLRILVALLLFCAASQAKVLRFKVPLSDLQDWAKGVVITKDAEIRGHSGVHLVQNDCEMHFGGSLTG